MLRKLVPKSTYARNVITLMTGTAFAQALPIAVSPILTRLYTPADFGVFAIYMAIASILGVLVTGRYELAILIPKQDRDAIHIAALSAGLSVVISGLLFLVVIAFNQPIAQLLGSPELSAWLYWVPASTLLSGIYQSLNYWSNRKSQYKRLAISRTAQSGSTSLAQWGAGYVGVGATGLVGGQLAGQVLSTAVLTRLICKEDKALIQTIQKNRIIAMAKKYLNFPKYLIVAHGFNTASSQMPVMLLGALFNSATAGFYTLIQRVMGAPMTLVAGALGDVFRQEASYAYAHNGNCKAIYKKTFKRLLLISIVPFLIFFFVAPPLFSFVFGADWRIAGEYAQILTPMFFLRFITSPLSSVYVFAEKQRIDLLWQVSLFFLVCLSLYFGSYQAEPMYSLIGFSLAYSFMYAINGFFSYRLASGFLR